MFPKDSSDPSLVLRSQGVLFISPDPDSDNDSVLLTFVCPALRRVANSS